jgi:hypothetical protein
LPSSDDRVRDQREADRCNHRHYEEGYYDGRKHRLNDWEKTLAVHSKRLRVRVGWRWIKIETVQCLTSGV